MSGVTGVFAMAGDGEPWLGVHTLPSARVGRLPSRIEEYRVAVVPSGVASCHSIDHTDEVWQPDGRVPRDSTMTALAPTGKALLLLGSGHATLPYGADGKLVLDYSKEGFSPVHLTLNDGSGGFYRARLVVGALAGGRSIDFGVLSFGRIKDNEFDSWHAATSRASPQPIRTSVVADGEIVWHISRRADRPQRLIGRVEGRSLTTVDVRLPDDTIQEYSGIYLVRGINHPFFSVPGESGSLVVDAQQRVIGTVLGGLRDEISYVLPIAALRERLASSGLADLFFTEAP